MTKKEQIARSQSLERLIRSAALSVHHSGSIVLLAEKAGISAETIRRSIREGNFKVGSASAIEAAVGRDIVKRESLCADLK